MRISMRFILLLGILALASVALAQSEATYSLVAWSTAPGGTTMTGGPYTAVGSAGDPMAGVAMAGGPYAVVGGFWGQVPVVPPPRLYLPALRRNE